VNSKRKSNWQSSACEGGRLAEAFEYTRSMLIALDNSYRYPANPENNPNTGKCVNIDGSSAETMIKVSGLRRLTNQTKVAARETGLLDIVCIRSLQI
jgi:hypothetical protein